MAKCDICGKGVTFGIKVSHSHRRSNRTWKPNVRRVKAMVDGSPKYIHACTRCIRSGQRLTRVHLTNAQYCNTKVCSDFRDSFFVCPA